MENIGAYKAYTFLGITSYTPAGKLPNLNVNYTASRCDIFTAFVNTRLGTHLTTAEVQELYAQKCGFITCGATLPPSNSINGPLLCGRAQSLDEPIVNLQDSPCSDSVSLAFITATEIYKVYKDSLNDVFNERYTQKCLGAALLESFSVQHPVSEYHYALYYYDQAGNLVKTISPEGVHPNRDPQWLAQVAQQRAKGLMQAPNHTLSTIYRYNSLNQVVSQQTPDAGLSAFWYDRLGRVAVSRNAKQQLENNYSYTLYDFLGRIKEVG